MFSFHNFLESFISAFSYVPVTLKLVIISFGLALIIGSTIAFVRAYQVPFLNKFFTYFVTIYRGIPTTVALVLFNLLFMTFFPVFVETFHLGIHIADINSIYVGYFVLALGSTCAVSETIRGAFQSVDKLQFEAGYSIGLSTLQTLFRIIIPQLIPVAMPGLINNLVGNIKGSNLVTAIGVIEIMGGALIPAANSYCFLEGYIAAALVYWMVDIVLEFITRRIEQKASEFRGKLA